MLDSYTKIKEGNIEVRFTGDEHKYAQLTLEKIKETAAFLMDYFNIQNELPLLRAILVPSRAEYERLVVNLLGVEIEIPSNPGRIAQPQRTDLVFLSPSAYKDHSVYEYVPEEYKRLVAHELIHVFEEYLTPDMEVIPRWWSEGLAVYLSGHWQHEDQFKFKQPVLQGIEEGSIPDLESIFNSIPMAYDWGWTLVMFIESTYGRNMVVKIVKKCDDGNILQVLKKKESFFEKTWRGWLLGQGKHIIYNRG